ncbi:Vesicle transport protein SEC20 [Rhynchospora pubera]|uniref:Vesicle transport protein SEC20 n=1 Tax=Rhynchospora pubera TaxID=906938 RepID=A0AAV8BRZ7_9POAL|nr:Vesicle transport protein SEC20 [Rhynchospora pubera]
MDGVTPAVENLKQEWVQSISQLQGTIQAIENCGKSVNATKEVNALSRLNEAGQDRLASLRSMQFSLDLLAQQLPTMEEVQLGQALMETWKEQYQRLHMGLRNANLCAKENMKKAAQEERELLLGGGEESTVRRRHLQIKAGMTSGAESITESFRRTHHMMAQEVERSASTLATFDESASILRKVESEYEGHGSMLARTHGLLSTMKYENVTDRMTLVFGFLIFLLAVLYVVSKRIGVLSFRGIL